MMVQVEHSEEEGTTIQHISDEGEGEAHADMDSAAIDLIRGSMSGVSKNSIIVEDDREQEDESREDSPVLRRPMWNIQNSTWHRDMSHSHYKQFTLLDNKDKWVRLN